MRAANACPLLCALVLLATPSLSYASPSCNTRSGFISEQPSAPLVRSASELGEGNERHFQFTKGDARDNETITLNLAKDIDSLIGITGRLTRGGDILGVRMENLPDFDKTKHCNRIALVVVKPRIERHADGSIRASVDHSVPGGRFSLEAKSGLPAWKQSSEIPGQLYWIFPNAFGKDSKSGVPWELTRSYEQAFQQAPLGSAKRRWIAEAYLNLVLRVYLGHDLQGGYPKGNRPNRDDLRKVFFEKSHIDCVASREDIRCLTMSVIETNEVGTSGDQISADAFRVSDAIYENSGVSAGIRQLDFGTNNDQALRLAPRLFPTTLGRQKLGYSNRRPIRLWDVSTLAQWYSVAGKQANEELSSDVAKQLLLESHVDFILDSTAIWSKRVKSAYPTWSSAEQATLVAVATDLENVSGYALLLESGRKGLCDVIAAPTLVGKKSNRSIVRSQYKRVVNAMSIAIKEFGDFGLEHSCIESLKSPAAQDAL